MSRKIRQPWSKHAIHARMMRGLGNTGEAMFNRLTSGLSVPCLNLPGFTGPNGLPAGVQVVGAMGNDLRLLRAAKWIAARVGDGEAVRGEAV